LGFASVSACHFETSFSMVKRRFGGWVRSRTERSQVNEVLCKVLCHNICVMIHSIYELGIARVAAHKF
jgi:hypothetical protein